MKKGCTLMGSKLTIPLLSSPPLLPSPPSRAKSQDKSGPSSSLASGSPASWTCELTIPLLPSPPPLPSLQGQVAGQIWVLLLAGIALAGVLDLWAGHTEPTILGLSALGSFISYIYSAPPLKLKQVRGGGREGGGEGGVALILLPG